MLVILSDTSHLTKMIDSSFIWWFIFQRQIHLNLASETCLFESHRNRCFYRINEKMNSYVPKGWGNKAKVSIIFLFVKVSKDGYACSNLEVRWEECKESYCYNRWYSDTWQVSVMSDIISDFHNRSYRMNLFIIFWVRLFWTKRVFFSSYVLVWYLQ